MLPFGAESARAQNAHLAQRQQRRVVALTAGLEHGKLAAQQRGCLRRCDIAIYGKNSLGPCTVQLGCDRGGDQFAKFIKATCLEAESSGRDVTSVAQER